MSEEKPGDVRIEIAPNGKIAIHQIDECIDIEDTIALELDDVPDFVRRLLEVSHQVLSERSKEVREGR